MNENNNMTEKKGAAIKPMTIVGIVLCLLLLPILVINVTLIIKSYVKSDEIPNIGGVFPMIVLTDSMYPEIQGGDLIFCRQTAPETVKVGDVICFFDPDGNGTSTVTHRVTLITETEEGELAFETKGDANSMTDRIPVPASKLVGVYQSRIPGFGKVAMFMQTTVGLIVCVVLPLILLVAIDLIRTRRYEKTHKQDTDALMKELEELRALQASAAAAAPTVGKENDPPKVVENPPVEERKKAPAAEELGDPQPVDVDEISSEGEEGIGDDVGEGIGDENGAEGGEGAGEGGGGDV